MNAVSLMSAPKIALKGSDCGTIQEGDCFWFDINGDLYVDGVAGWVQSNDAKEVMKSVEFVYDTERMLQRIMDKHKELQRQLKLYAAAISENKKRKENVS